MAQRRLEEIAVSVQRRTDGGVSMGEIIDAIGDANKELHTSYEWPWAYGESTVRIQPPYTTGTVDATDGTTLITLTGGTWDAAWKYKRIYVGGNNISYRVASFTPTTCTLVDALNLGSNLVASPYTVFQDIYPTPTDCDPGDILLIVNPKLRYRLRYLPTYTFAWQNIWPGTFMSNFQFGFCDYGWDEPSKTHLIMFAPPIGAVTEFVMIYRKRPPDLTLVSQTLPIPDSYDRILELMATYMVKTNRGNPLPGWMLDKQEAYQIAQKMRRRVANPMKDVMSVYSNFPYLDEGRNTAYGDGLFLNGMTVGTYP